MKFLLLRWVLLGGVMAILIAVPVYLTLTTQFPTDEELIEFFQANQAGFDQLRQELEAEPANIRGFSATEVLVNESAGDWVPPNQAGVTPTRFQAFQELMQAHEVDFLWRQDAMVLIRAGFSGWGSSGKGPRLCYVYTLHSPPHQVTRLLDIRDEHYQIKEHDWHLVYKPLGENWYIRLIW